MRLVGAAGAGFVLYFFSKVVYALGLSATLPVSLAAWTPPWSPGWRASARCSIWRTVEQSWPFRFGPGRRWRRRGDRPCRAVVFPADRPRRRRPGLCRRRGVFLWPGCRCSVRHGALPDLAIGATILAAMLGIGGLGKRARRAGSRRGSPCSWASSLAIGPGLVVNTLLKDHWGRARPHQILEFGGTAHFSPAVLISDQCARNCPSHPGHAALGFWLVAFAAVVPDRWKMPDPMRCLTIGLLVGLCELRKAPISFRMSLLPHYSWLVLTIYSRN